MPTLLPPRCRAATALLALLLAAAGCAGLDAGVADQRVEGTYVGGFDQRAGSDRITLVLNQNGRRLSGTYTLQVGGRVQDGSVSGLYSAPTVELTLSGPDGDAAFEGVVSGEGRVLEGQLEVGAGPSYSVTLQRQ